MPDKDKPGGIFQKPINRRNFIKIGAATAAAGAMGTGLSGCEPEIYQGHYSDVPENHVSLSPNRKRVLILGGGFRRNARGLRTA